MHYQNLHVISKLSESENFTKLFSWFTGCYASAVWTCIISIYNVLRSLHLWRTVFVNDKSLENIRNFHLYITKMTSHLICDGLYYKIFFVPEPTMTHICGDQREPFEIHFMNNNQQVWLCSLSATRVRSEKLPPGNSKSSGHYFNRE